MPAIVNGDFTQIACHLQKLFMFCLLWIRTAIPFGKSVKISDDRSGIRVPAGLLKFPSLQ